MPKISRLVVALLAAWSVSARASMPCAFPQVTIFPRTNTTGVTGAVRVDIGWPVKPPLSSDPSEYLLVEDENGQPVDVSMVVTQSSYMTAVVLGEFPQPGWYTIRVLLPPHLRESSDSSMLPGTDDFSAELLVGRSEPGVSRVSVGGGEVSVRWSEPVRFAVEPAEALQLFGPSGEPLSCVNARAVPDAGYDGGLVYFVTLKCSDTQVDSFRVVSAPFSADGSVATFPGEGELWQATKWTESVWQPSVRRRTHESLTVTGLTATYKKCELLDSGCSCSGLVGSATCLWLAMALLVRSRVRRAR